MCVVACARVQEQGGPAQEEGGRMPRTLEVEMQGGLVDAAAVGDVVRVLGLVRVLNADAAAGASASPGCPAVSCLASLLLFSVL